MSIDSLYETLASAARDASAITLRADLIPANAVREDEKFFVLPPTYADKGHLASHIREDDTHEYILIDSPQSWANRLEEFLDRQEVGVAPIELEVAGRTLTVNELPHRIFDALLRDAELDGQSFRSTTLGMALTGARAENATALLQSAPGTLLFGGWDSFAGAKMGAAKWPAALSGQIIGFDALQTKKAGIRIDPMNIARDAVTGFKAESRPEVWTSDEAKAATDDKKKPISVDKASEIGHGHIPAAVSTKGAWVRRIELRSSLSLTRLRRYRFPVDGRTSPEADVAARTYLAALGLWLMHTRLMAGLELRAGAELDATQAAFLVRSPLRSDAELEVSAASVGQALEKAIEQAVKAGFKFAEPTKFKASAKLEKLIQASDALNQ